MHRAAHLTVVRKRAQPDFICQKRKRLCRNDDLRHSLFLRYEVRRHFVIQVLSSKLYLLCHFDRARAFFG